jgi:hypothetical protein
MRQCGGLTMLTGRGKLSPCFGQRRGPFRTTNRLKRRPFRTGRDPVHGKRVPVRGKRAPGPLKRAPGRSKRDPGQLKRDPGRGKRAPVHRERARIDFNGRSPAGDLFSYEGWGGFHDLIKFNGDSPALRDHLFKAVDHWGPFPAPGTLRSQDCIVGILSLSAEIC